MKGEYDATLSWPFNKEVTFTLIDQEEDLLKWENIVGKLTPDSETQASFLRPKGEGNLGYGKPQLLSHLRLQSKRYVVDDTLFFSGRNQPMMITLVFLLRL